MRATTYQMILTYLASQSQYVKAQTVADYFGVSAKTIYRAIHYLNTLMAQPVVMTVKGKGVKLTPNLDQAALTTQLQATGYPAAQRRRLLALELLYRSPNHQRLADCAAHFFVSESVISMDLVKLAQQLQSFQLKVSRSAHHVTILGNETAVRKAILAQTDQMRAMQLMDASSSNRVMEPANQIDVLFITNEIEKIERLLQIKLPHPYDINLFTHLHILVQRTRTTGTARLSQVQLTANEQQLIAANDTVYQVSKVIKQDIEQFLNVSLSAVEAFYVFEYLISSHYYERLPKGQTQLPLTAQVVARYLQLVPLFLTHPLDFSPIRPALTAHIGPMLNRLQQQIVMKNNLLTAVQMEYPQLFAAVQKASLKISAEYQLASVPLDEVAATTVYFATEMERHPYQLKTLIIGDTRIGTAELLRSKVTRLYPELQVVGVQSKRDFEQHPVPAVALLLATTLVDSDLPTVMISPILGASDRAQVRQKIRELRVAR